MTEAATAAGAAHWFPATAASRMGGDLHAVRRSPYGLRLLIGDVRGQGAAAAAGAYALLAAFDRAAPAADTLEELADALETAMIGHARSRADGFGAEDFATAALVEVGDGGRTLRLLDRGHPAPLLLRPEAVLPLSPVEPGPPLGLRELAPTTAESLTVRFPADATLLLLTDGTTEARNADGAFYDPVARLAGHGAAAPEDVVRLVRREVRAHVARRVGGRPADDMALLALRAGRTCAASPSGA